MPSLYNILYRRLQTIDALVDLVDARVYEGEAASDALPYVVIDVEQERMDALEVADGTRYYTAEIHVVASAPQQRDTISQLLVDSLDYSDWTDEGATVSGVDFQNGLSSKLS